MVEAKLLRKKLKNGLIVDKWDLVTIIEKQQAEIEELKTCLIVEQEHNERMVEDRSNYEVLAHAGGVEAGKELKELTDEEIWELHQEHIDEVICGHHMKTVGFIEFARAILRKASEK